MTTLWHVYEEEGLDGADPRIDWFATKREASNRRKEWLIEHREAADEDVEIAADVVVLKKVVVPTDRAALARWLYALEVRDL